MTSSIPPPDRVKISQPSGPDPKPVTPSIDCSIPESDRLVIESEKEMRLPKIRKLETLEPEKSRAIIDLEKEIKNFEERFLTMRGNFLLHQQSPENVALRVTYLTQERELKLLGSELAKTFSKLGLLELDLNLLRNPENTFVSFICQKEKILNAIVNQCFFLANLKVFLNSNRERIIQEFQGAKLLSTQHQSADVERVDLDYFEKDAEKHNQGKSVVLVHFVFTDKPVFKFICKPRDALLDQSVINLFKTINQLPSEQKASLHTHLCEYTIISPSAKDGWKIDPSLGAVSLWEFIDGRRAQYQRNARLCIKLEIKNASQRDMMFQKLNYLDAILTELSISDLHYENVLFYDLQGPNSEIFPIDLENIQWGEPSQLGGKPKEVALIGEKEHIEKLKTKITNLVVRILPEGTGVLAALSSYEFREYLTEKCIKELEKQNLEIDSKESFKQLLLRNILNSDIPYLTILQNVLYWGMPNEGIKIGGKKDV